jgi:hypothetical protein
MTAVVILLAFIVGLAFGYLAMVRRSKPTYLASAEYWVYFPGEQMPDQNEVMARMVGRNPYTKQGRSPIGPAEGLLFSDVRLHIALVRRSVNAHVFRPDLFADVEIDAESFQALNDANSFAKIRYLSEEPLPDKRHLQFLMHASDAVASLGNGSLIYDRTAERMYRKADLERLLAENLDVTGPEFHLRTVWNPEPHGGRVETKGFRKIGRNDLRTETIESDEELIVTAVMEEAAGKIWEKSPEGDSVEVEAFEDHFRVVLEKSNVEPTPVKVLRIQTL